MQNIIITGASSGIGKAFKEYYEKQGNTVYNISREAEIYACDVTDRQKLTEVFSAIQKKAGTIDMLINCAGFGLSGAIELTPIEQVQREFDVNVIGIVNCVQLVLPMMHANGKIINISSASALFPIPYRGFYGATKAAVSAITDSLRMELCQTKIQVTALCPSDIKTNFTKNRGKVFTTNERYKDAIRLSTLKIDNREDKRMPLEKAIRIMTRWIKQKHLKPQYIMTVKFKLMYFAKGVLPKSWYLKICNKVMNVTK